jgi:hypothetical protein
MPQHANRPTDATEPSIEDIILAQDKRGIASLRPYLSPRFCEEAARFLLAHPGPTLIATGFYIARAHAPETDGPPGALALGNALASLGHAVAYVSDRYTAPLLTRLTANRATVIDFPIIDTLASRQYASQILAQWQPALLIAIERCGLTSQDAYLNMRGQDISRTTARLDDLFLQHPHTIGIGDGGNEIGMGNLASHIPHITSLPAQPAMTPTTHLVIASVANWGAYGILTALSFLLGKSLLPAVQDETARIRQAVDFGAVDGTTGNREYTVDGFSLEENAGVLERLHHLLAHADITPP